MCSFKQLRQNRSALVKWFHLCGSEFPTPVSPERSSIVLNSLQRQNDALWHIFSLKLKVLACNWMHLISHQSSVRKIWFCPVNTWRYFSPNRAAAVKCWNLAIVIGYIQLREAQHLMPWPACWDVPRGPEVNRTWLLLNWKRQKRRPSYCP